MVHRIGRRKFRIFAYDVESHNDPWSVEHRETSIWLSSLIDETSKPEDESIYFYTIDSFLDRLEQLSTPKIIHGKRPIRNICIYVYNLSFEWSFILPVLLKRGFAWKERLDPKKDTYSYNTITTKSVSSVWSIKLRFGDKSGTVMFRDLCKIYPGGLRNIAKSFGLATQKGEIEYEKDRRSPDYVPTPEEKFYNFKDNEIVIEILEKMTDDREFWRATSAASYSVLKLLHYAYPKSHRPLRSYRKQYPMLGTKETECLRKSVGGGITYATPNYQFRELTNLGHIDAHQMHPSQIVSHLFPFGKGTYYTGKPFCIRGARQYLCHIKVSYSGVRLHSVIKLIGYELASSVDLWVWDFEIPTMRKCYIDLEIKYIDGYAYHVRKVPWAGFCAENYAKRKIAKANKDQFGIMYYKLLNNSGAYGKFLERPHEEVFENVINADGQIDSKEHNKTPRAVPEGYDDSDGSLECNATYTYLPYGSSIPAWSRVCLIETALKFGWKNIVYFDTDSIFYVRNEETDKALKALDTRDELCCWGIENPIDKAEFSAPKRYKLIEEENGKKNTVIHMAGINFSTEKEYDQVNIDNDEYEVQRIERVRGGTVIVRRKKQIGVQEKYKMSYLKNKLVIQDDKV